MTETAQSLKGTPSGVSGDYFSWVVNCPPPLAPGKASETADLLPSSPKRDQYYPLMWNKLGFSKP